MNDVIEKIFAALGVKPNERFKIKDDNSGDSYYLDKNLSGYCVEKDDSLVPFNANFLQDILRGKVEIVNIPKKIPSAKDKIIIDYAKLCGYNWIAVDEDDEIVFSEEKPFRKNDGEGYWEVKKGDRIELSYCGFSPNCYQLSFLTWEDEPYYIGE